MKGFMILLSLAALLALPSCQNPGNTEVINTEPVDYVNPYMGSISHLLVPTFPTVQLPHSMMRVIPYRREFKDITMAGLPVFVSSHRGANAFSLSPCQGSTTDLMPVINYTYDHEKITPYSYSVYLDEYGIQAELGVSHQSAMYEILFREEGPSHLVIQANDGLLEWDGEALSGYESIGGGTNVFIYMVPDREPAEVFGLKNGMIEMSARAEGRQPCLK